MYWGLHQTYVVLCCTYSDDFRTAAHADGHIADEGAFCGGLKGFQCKKGEVCVDDPWDTCNPEKGGRDCGGICVRFEESEW